MKIPDAKNRAHAKSSSRMKPFPMKHLPAMGVPLTFTP